MTLADLRMAWDDLQRARRIASKYRHTPNLGELADCLDDVARILQDLVLLEQAKRRMK